VGGSLWPLWAESESGRHSHRHAGSPPSADESGTSHSHRDVGSPLSADGRSPPPLCTVGCTSSAQQTQHHVSSQRGRCRCALGGPPVRPRAAHRAPSWIVRAQASMGICSGSTEVGRVAAPSELMEERQSAESGVHCITQSERAGILDVFRCSSRHSLFIRRRRLSCSSSSPAPLVLLCCSSSLHTEAEHFCSPAHLPRCIAMSVRYRLTGVCTWGSRMRVLLHLRSQDA